MDLQGRAFMDFAGKLPVIGASEFSWKLVWLLWTWSGTWPQEQLFPLLEATLMWGWKWTGGKIAVIYQGSAALWIWDYIHRAAQEQEGRRVSWNWEERLQNAHYHIVYVTKELIANFQQNGMDKLNVTDLYRENIVEMNSSYLYQYKYISKYNLQWKLHNFCPILLNLQ
jgi:hypothetical protein